MQSVSTIYPRQATNAVKKITVITDPDPYPRAPQRYFADGLPGIMFHQAGDDILLNSSKKLSPLFFYGQTVKPIEITTYGPFKAIIFHLYSHVTNGLFGIDANELTDTCLDYDLLIGNHAGELTARLLDLESTHQQIDLLYQSLQKVLFKIKTASSFELHWAVECLVREEEPLTVIRQKLKITERTFERKFLQHVGVTPSLFRRICKFNTALRDIEEGSYDKLTDVAYKHGFSDQSHFNRTFKEFTGLTPREYIKTIHSSFPAGNLQLSLT